MPELHVEIRHVMNGAAEEVGFNGSRRHCVRGNPAFSEFLGHEEGQDLDGSLGGLAPKGIDLLDDRLRIASTAAVGQDDVAAAMPGDADCSVAAKAAVTAGVGRPKIRRCGRLVRRLRRYPLPLRQRG
jgi:hypothetical protein